MNREEPVSHAFVLRVWLEDGEDPATLRGWVQHASTGQITYVQSMEELASFLERWVGSLEGEGLPVKTREEQE